MDLAQMRTRLRQDLHDQDASSYRWVDAVLDRHVARALQEFSLASPLESKATLTTTLGSRELSLSSITDIVVIEAVEYPVGKYPPRYIPFSRWGTGLTMLIDGTPGAAEQVNLYYGKLHTLNATTSTIPSHLEDLVATGAGGYAAVEWANFAVNRVNVGGQDVWRHYLSWGQEKLAAFHKGLAKHGRRSMVRVKQLYRPAQPPASQSTDWGP